MPIRNRPPRARAIALLLLTSSALAVPPSPRSTAPARTITADAFVGRWYVAPSMQDGIAVDDIVTRKSDHTLAIDFRICDGGKLLNYTEEGTWSVAGDLYLARTHISRTVDGKAPDGAVYEERYRVEQASSDRLVYRDIGTGSRSEANRVSEDFAPPGDLCALHGDRKSP